MNHIIYIIIIPWNRKFYTEDEIQLNARVSFKDSPSIEATRAHGPD